MDPFGKSPVQSQEPQILEDIGVLSRRVKLLENALSTLRGSLQNLEKNYIDSQKEDRRDIKIIEAELDELKDAFRQTKENVKLLASDLENAAQEDDVKVIQKYLDMWSPVKFITLEQAKRLIKDEVEYQLGKQIEKEKQSEKKN